MSVTLEKVTLLSLRALFSTWIRIPQHVLEAIMSVNSDSVECWAEMANFLTPSQAEHQHETGSADAALLRSFDQAALLDPLMLSSADTAVTVGKDQSPVQNLAEMSEQVVYPLIT